MFDGQSVLGRSLRDQPDMGISRVFQERPNLRQYLSVQENIA